MKTFILDFETYYSKDYSLSRMTMVEYILDVRFQPMLCAIKEYGSGQPAEVIHLNHYEGGQRLLAMLKAQRCRVVAHNAMFDCAILAWHYGYVPDDMFCTMMGARPHMVPYSRSMGLDKLTKWLRDNMDNPPAPLVKGKGTEVVAMQNRRMEDLTQDEKLAYGRYCAADVDLCEVLYTEQERSLSLKDRTMLYMTLRKFVVPQLHVDTDLLFSYAADIINEKEALLRRVGMDDRKTLMSNALFAQVLRDHGVEPPMKISPTTGKPTYAFAKSDEGLKKLLDNPPSRAVEALIAARLGHKSTIEETRVQRLKATGLAFEYRKGKPLLPFPLLYFGAHTGRLSGHDKLNLQNLTRGSTLREAIVAPPGYKLVVADLSQIEARMLAVLAGEWGLVEQFAQGEDVYASFATTLYEYPVHKDTHPVQRFIGKTAILGLGYGCGATKFYDMLRSSGVTDATHELAKSTVDIYRNTYRLIPKLWRRCNDALDYMVRGADAYEVHPLITASGCTLRLAGGERILHYPQLVCGEGEYTYANNRGVRVKLYGGKMVENIVQALAQLVLRDAEYRMFDVGKQRGLSLFAAGQVHDELIYCVPEHAAQTIAEVLRWALTRTPTWADSYIPLDCEVHIADNYKAAK